MDILAQLNDQQKQAVTHTDGPVLVLAGAGSGKTRTLTYRAAWLIEQQLAHPHELILLTFTNKAAEEMLGRVRQLIGQSSLSASGPAASRPSVFGGTFHSFCARILRKYGQLISLENDYVIYDADDQETLIKVALDKLKVDAKKFRPKSALAAISEAKNELIKPADYFNYARSSYQETIAELYQAYQKLLRQAAAVDFDDLLSYTVDLFQNHPTVLNNFQQQLKYVLVDEYQDTNKAQYVLTKLLAGKHKNLMAVGDFSQSIYSWRGADFRNLQHLKQDFPDLVTINLEQNYRSTQNILSGANQVIQKNTLHPVLRLWTDKPAGKKIAVYPARNELDEARFVVNSIQEKLLTQHKTYGDFAVLYRTNAQSRVMEEALLHGGIPYLLVGGTRFYQRREIKDIISYLRLIANPKDTVSEERIKKLGKHRWETFVRWREKLNENPSSSSSTQELMDRVLDATGYLERFDPEDQDDFARLENIKELRSVADRFPDLTQFLENVALVEQETTKELETGRTDKVTLMTVHAAKGLEFNTVFMIGMEEGLFPHSRSQLDHTQMEEERRLCYVGMTRAMEQLYLTYAYHRLYFGRSTSYAISRFITDIPEELINNLNGSSPIYSLDNYQPTISGDDLPF